MKNALGQWWTVRTARQRRLIGLLGMALGLMLYAWLVGTATQARERLLPSVAQLRVDAARQARQADEILRLRAAPKASSADADLRQIVRAAADAGGLGGALVSVERMGAREVKVVFAQLAFSAWLEWAEAMQAQQLRFASVRMESQAAPGQVSVTATLERPAR